LGKRVGEEMVKDNKYDTNTVYTCMYMKKMVSVETVLGMGRVENEGK
jgi:hypothetical protein